MPSDTKTCFVITPTGDEGSEERTRSDQILNHVIGPMARDCGYNAIRAASYIGTRHNNVTNYSVYR